MGRGDGGGGGGGTRRISIVLDNSAREKCEKTKSLVT